MTPKTEPKPITPARLARLRKTDAEFIELLDTYVSARLQHITRERAQLLKLRRFLAPTEGEPR